MRFLLIFLFICGSTLHSQNKTYPYDFKYEGNPLSRQHGAADPDAHVWDDTVWLYTSQDHEGGYENMDGYHAFSSKDMVNWTDHGEILHSRDVSWGLEAGGYMWAPGAARKKDHAGNYKYYLYFPHRDSANEWKIGVALSDKPEGPFTDIGHWIEGTSGIDPSILVDDDGQAYMYFDHNKMAKLKDNMVEFAEKPIKLNYGGEAIMGNSHLNASEGPFIHKRNGIYYYSFTNLDNKAGYTAMYSMADNPYGPFDWQGPIAKEARGAQNHHSIIEFKGQSYFFYHVSLPNIPAVKKGQARIASFDKLFYNPDDTIQMVVRTLGPKNSLTITSAKNGYYSFNPAGGSYDAGTEVTIIAHANLGYKFTGWSGDVNSTENFLSIVVDEDYSLNAHFTPSSTHMLATHAENGSVRLSSTAGPYDGKITPGLGVFNQGTQVELTAVAKFGYKFDSWSGGLSGSEIRAILMLDQDSSVTANFVKIPVYRLSLQADNGTFKVTPPAARYEQGSEVTVEAIKDFGYAFKGWNGDLHGTKNPHTLTMDADKQISAKFDYVGNGDTLAFAVNSGGDAYKSVDGVRYRSDTGTDGLSYKTSNDIRGTEDDPLFQRYTFGEQFSVKAPLPRGEYEVSLLFAETFFGESGSRVFDVFIEGKKVMSNFDLAGEIGKNVACTKVFDTTVTDGELNIAFSASVDNAIISAIKVIRKNKN
jgi:arabinoxylan arabinofuranohydrolase